MTTTPRDAGRRDAVRYSDQPEQDRAAYLDEVRAKMALRRDSNGMHAVAQNVTTGPETYGRYAERRAAILRRGYEQMGVALADLAAEASQTGDSYFALITGEQA